jgi:hypothetical protein
MKKSVIVVVALFASATFVKAQSTSAPTGTASAVATQVNPNAPEAEFEKEVLDYGTIAYDSNGEREFKFKNTGKEPLIIYSATGSCGCTVPTAPKEPIKPGETGVIKVHYDTKRPGNFEKTVTVSTNGKTANKTLRIKGIVQAAPAPAPSATVAPH